MGLSLCKTTLIWEIVGDVCGFEISFDRILGTEDCNGYDYVLTLISFLKKKEWKKRRKKPPLSLY